MRDRKWTECCFHSFFALDLLLWDINHAVKAIVHNNIFWSVWTSIFAHTWKSMGPKTIPFSCVVEAKCFLVVQWHVKMLVWILHKIFNTGLFTMAISNDVKSWWHLHNCLLVDLKKSIPYSIFLYTPLPSAGNGILFIPCS